MSMSKNLRTEVQRLSWIGLSGRAWITLRWLCANLCDVLRLALLRMTSLGRDGGLSMRSPAANLLSLP
jgi:hypothetical protein